MVIVIVIGKTRWVSQVQVHLIWKWQNIVSSTSSVSVIPHSAEIFLYKPWGPKGSLQFGIHINVLVSSFRFI